MFKVCALLSITPAQMCLIVVLMLYRVILFECRPSTLRIIVSYSSRSVLDVLQKTSLKFLLVELRHFTGGFWREILLSF